MNDNLLSVDLGTGRTATQIAVGVNHSCALLDNGDVKCWGANGSGQLGQGHMSTLGDGAGEMGDSLPAISLGAGTVIQISAGSYHSCALFSNNNAICWGDNTYGQLGLEHTQNIGDDETPVSGGNVMLGILAEITAHDYFTCARLTDNNVMCWGQGTDGRLGSENTMNLGDDSGEMSGLGTVFLGTSRTARQLSPGGHASHACALLDNDDVKCWGRNISGQLGQENLLNLGDNTAEMGDNLAAIDGLKSNPPCSTWTPSGSTACNTELHCVWGTTTCDPDVTGPATATALTWAEGASSGSQTVTPTPMPAPAATVRGSTTR